LRFVVQDDGQGFDPASAGHGSGLTNMADRVDALGGTLDVSSSPGHGTTVRVALTAEGRELARAATWS
jgi:signal transduction histidine kinase